MEDALSEVKGINSINVELNTKCAVIDAGPEVKDQDIKNAIHEAGYDVASIEPEK